MPMGKPGIHLVVKPMGQPGVQLIGLESRQMRGNSSLSKGTKKARVKRNE